MNRFGSTIVARDHCPTRARTRDPRRAVSPRARSNRSRAPMTTTTRQSLADAELTGFQKALILVTVSTCTMLYALTATVINVALPQLQGALSATPDQIAWVVTLNVVATAVVTPMTGWLVAALGQRWVMLGSVAGFAVTSLFCATALTLESLLVWRVGQGIFGAPIVPLSQAILLAAYPGKDRAMAQGLFGMSVVIGPAIAPALGGYLAQAYDWRWIFYLIIPFCFAAFFLALAFVREGGRDAATHLDWTGFIALSVAVICLQLMVDRGERLGWLESGEFIVYACLAALAFYMFLAHTMTAKAPFLNPTLFTDRNYTLGLVLVFVYGMLNFTPITLLPPLLQALKGISRLADRGPARHAGGRDDHRVLSRQPPGRDRPPAHPRHRHRVHRGERRDDGDVRIQRPAVPGGDGRRDPGDRQWIDVGAPHRRRLLDAAAEVAPRGRVDLPPPAELRIEPLHLDKLHGRGALRQGELFGTGRDPLAVQRDAPLLVRHGRLDARRHPRPHRAELRGPSPGNDESDTRTLSCCMRSYASRHCRCCCWCVSSAISPNSCEAPRSPVHRPPPPGGQT